MTKWTLIYEARDLITKLLIGLGKSNQTNGTGGQKGDCLRRPSIRSEIEGLLEGKGNDRFFGPTPISREIRTPFLLNKSGILFVAQDFYHANFVTLESQQEPRRPGSALLFEKTFETFRKELLFRPGVGEGERKEQLF